MIEILERKKFFPRRPALQIDLNKKTFNDITMKLKD